MALERMKAGLGFTAGKLHGAARLANPGRATEAIGFAASFSSPFTVEFGSDQLTTTGNFPDIFVARITPGGEVLWAAQGGGPLPDDAFGVAVDAVGNSVVVGTVAGTNTFGSLTLTNPAQARIVVAACDPMLDCPGG